MDDRTNYIKTWETYLSKAWNDATELNNFAWGIYEQAAAEDNEDYSGTEELVDKIKAEKCKF